MRTYRAPTSTADLVAALAAATDPILIAGGQSLLPSLREKRIRSGELIDIGRVASLKDIVLDDGGATIGAGVVMADLAKGQIAKRLPMLACAAGWVGNHVVRGRSTLGGSLAWANPRAEMPTVMMALDAIITTQHRSFPARQLMTGAFTTILERGEAILSVRVPDSPRMVFDEVIPRNSTGRAVVAIACADVGNGDVSVTLAGLTDIPIFDYVLKQGQPFTDSSISEAIRGHAPSAHFTSLEYRIAAARVLANRCRDRLQD